MGVHRLSRWQKAGALVPMAVLVGIWGGALTNSDLTPVASGSDRPGIPDVPAAPFEQPATVQVGNPAGIDQRAGAAGTLSTLAINGIPAAALLAYRRAETLLARADGSCHLPWTLLAAIGRVESNHGRTGGNTVSADGVSKPGIFGILLTGANGTTRIGDTDGGTLDRDAVYDRAVGPMQFLPGTWKSAAVDADGDGVKNPQDIDDAAAAGGVYLCSGSGDLGTPAGASAAVLRYNHSSAYVDLVLKIAAAYARGEYSQAPDGYPAATVLTSKSLDHTRTPGQRKHAHDAEARSHAKEPGSKSSKAPATPRTHRSAPAGETPSPAKPRARVAAPAPPRAGTITGAVGDALGDSPLKPLTAPVVDLVSPVEAQVRCMLEFPLGLPTDKFGACVDDLSRG